MMWLMLLLAVGAAACSSVVPDAGHEAVIIRKPMFFGSGGVSDTPVKTGRKYVSWTTQSIDVNMQPQRIDIEFADLMTTDGVPIDFHAVVTYQVLDSVKLAANYGAYWTEGNPPVPTFFVRNLDQPFRTAVRDEVKRHGMNEMAFWSKYGIDPFVLAITLQAKS